MKNKWMMLALMGVLFFPGWVQALDEKAFLVDTTADLMLLCGAPESNPLHKEAVSFCFGFLEGAYHYHVLTQMGPKGKQMVCLPDPPPQRAQVVNLFMDWVKERSEYLNEEPVETWFRFLMETYPCKD